MKTALLLTIFALVSLGCSKGKDTEEHQLRAEAARYLVQDVGHIPASYGYSTGASGFNVREMPECETPVPTTQDPDFETDEEETWPTLEDTGISDDLSEVIQSIDDIPLVEEQEVPVSIEVTETAWETNLRDAKAVAVGRGAPLIVIFKTQNCAYCEKLIEECKDDIEELYSGSFVLCLTSTDLPPGRRLYPTAAVLRSSGRLVAPLIKGYPGKTEFMKKLKGLTGKAR